MSGKTTFEHQHIPVFAGCIIGHHAILGQMLCGSCVQMERLCWLGEEWKGCENLMNKGVNGGPKARRQMTGFNPL